MNYNSGNHNQISEFLDYIENIRKYSEHTIRSYRVDLIQFSEYLYKCDKCLLILDIEKENIQEYLFSLHAKKKSDKTIARKVASLKSLFSFLIKHNIVDKNIMSNFRTPKVSKKLPHLLSKKEIDDLFNLDLSDNKILMEVCILELFYATGMRISELTRVKISNINFEGQTIRVLGKGNKERFVLLSSNSIAILRKYLSLFCDSGQIYLFGSFIQSRRLNNHISEKAIYNITKKHLKRISNDEKLTPHSLRHSFATHLLDSGADIMSVKDLLGHESLTSTQVYTHVKLDKMKRDYNKSHPLSK